MPDKKYITYYAGTPVKENTEKTYEAEKKVMRNLVKHYWGEDHRFTEEEMNNLFRDENGKPFESSTLKVAYGSYTVNIKMPGYMTAFFQMKAGKRIQFMYPKDTKPHYMSLMPSVETTEKGGMDFAMDEEPVPGKTKDSVSRNADKNFRKNGENLKSTLNKDAVKKAKEEKKKENEKKKKQDEEKKKELKKKNDELKAKKAEEKRLKAVKVTGHHFHLRLNWFSNLFRKLLHKKHKVMSVSPLDEIPKVTRQELITDGWIFVNDPEDKAPAVKNPEVKAPEVKTIAVPEYKNTSPDVESFEKVVDAYVKEKPALTYLGNTAKKCMQKLYENNDSDNNGVYLFFQGKTALKKNNPGCVLHCLAAVTAFNMAVECNLDNNSNVKLDADFVKKVSDNHDFRKAAGFIKENVNFDDKMVRKFIATHGGSFSKIQKDLEKANKYTHKISIQHPNMGYAPIAR